MDVASLLRLFVHIPDVVCQQPDLTEGRPNPRLASHLPGWLLAELGLRSRRIVAA
jgi:hypothetical protein